MKVVDLHPEDLLDREAQGDLTEVEHDRLMAHLERCATCRFERQTKLDFEGDLVEQITHEDEVADLVSLVLRTTSGTLSVTGTLGTLGTLGTPGTAGSTGALGTVAASRTTVATGTSDTTGALGASGSVGRDTPSGRAAPTEREGATAPITQLSASTLRARTRRFFVLSVIAAALLLAGVAAAAAGLSGIVHPLRLVSSKTVEPTNTTETASTKPAPRAVGRASKGSPSTTGNPNAKADDIDAKAAIDGAVTGEEPTPSNRAETAENTVDPSTGEGASSGTSPSPHGASPSTQSTRATQATQATESGRSPGSAGPTGPNGQNGTAIAGGVRRGDGAMPNDASRRTGSNDGARGPGAKANATDPLAEAPEVHTPAGALFSQANDARRSGNDEAAIRAYRELLERFPASPEASVARATLGKMLLDRGEGAAALKRFDESLAAGAGAMTEEMLLGRAASLERMGDRKAEAVAWNALLSSYPTSAHAARARARLAALASR